MNELLFGIHIGEIEKITGEPVKFFKKMEKRNSNELISHPLCMDFSVWQVSTSIKKYALGIG